MPKRVCWTTSALAGFVTRPQAENQIGATRLVCASLINSSTFGYLERHQAIPKRPGRWATRSRPSLRTPRPQVPTILALRAQHACAYPGHYCPVPWHARNWRCYAGVDDHGDNHERAKSIRGQRSLYGAQGTPNRVFQADQWCGDGIGTPEKRVFAEQLAPVWCHERVSLTSVRCALRDLGYLPFHNHISTSATNRYEYRPGNTDAQLVTPDTRIRSRQLLAVPPSI